MTETRKVSRELIAASSEPILLTILNQGESYGYAILQKVRLCSSEQIVWGEGMLYPVLHRLEIKGLIKARWEKGDGGPRRKLYRITSKGKKHLEQRLRDWTLVTQTLEALCKTNLT